VREVDNFGAREARIDDTFHDRCKRTLMPEVGRDRYDARALHALFRQSIQMPIGVAEYLRDDRQPLEVVANIKFPTHAHAAV